MLSGRSTTYGAGFGKGHLSAIVADSAIQEIGASTEARSAPFHMRDGEFGDTASVGKLNKIFGGGTVDLVGVGIVLFNQALKCLDEVASLRSVQFAGKILLNHPVGSCKQFLLGDIGFDLVMGTGVTPGHLNPSILPMSLFSAIDFGLWE